MSGGVPKAVRAAVRAANRDHRLRHPIEVNARKGFVWTKHRFTVGQRYPGSGVSMMDSVDADGAPSAAMIEVIARVASHAVRREAWEAEMGLGPMNGPLETHRMLVHPLSLHAGRPARDIVTTHDRDYDAIIGFDSVRLGAGVQATASARLDGSWLAVPIQVPDTIAHSSGGRPLSEVVAIPATGVERVDRAVAGLVVAHGEIYDADAVAAGQHHLRLHLKPATWLLLEEPPEAERGRVRFHIDHPLVA